MTVSDCIAVLEAAFPERTISCGVQAWSNYFDWNGKRERRVEFCVHLHPGINGEKCSRFPGFNLQECVDKALVNADVKGFESANEATSDIELVTIGSNPA